MQFIGKVLCSIMRSINGCPMTTEEKQEDGKRPRRAPRTMEFTELGLKRMNVRKAVAKAGKASQVQIWDTGTNGQRGLSVLLSSGGTKTPSW